MEEQKAGGRFFCPFFGMLNAGQDIEESIKYRKMRLIYGWNDTDDAAVRGDEEAVWRLHSILQTR
jgi:hypothetical protein